MTATAKTCSKCGEVKALEEFPKHRMRKDGLDNRCKQCACNAAKAYRATNIEAVREKERLRSAAMPLWQKREKHKSWRDANKDYVRTCGRETMNSLYQKNPEKFRTKSREYHASNRERVIAHSKKSRKELRDSYVATTLRMKTADVPPELIALKREQLAIKRMARELKQAANPTGVTQ